MGLFTLHNCCVSWLLNFLKLKLDSQSHYTIPEFSGYHCIFVESLSNFTPSYNVKIQTKRVISVRINTSLNGQIHRKNRQKKCTE